MRGTRGSYLGPTRVARSLCGIPSYGGQGVIKGTLGLGILIRTNGPKRFGSGLTKFCWRGALATSADNNTLQGLIRPLKGPDKAL